MSKYIKKPYKENKICKTCKKNYEAKSKNQLYCTECKSELYVGNGYKNINSSTVGAIAELEICSDLLKKGYEVFRAVSPACSCDLVISKDGKNYRIEVRSGYVYAKGIISANKGNRADILAIYVHRTKEIIYESILSIELINKNE